MTPVLVTGGTGTLGRAVVHRLLDDGRQVRVVSRGRQPRAGTVEHVVGDLRTGSGLDRAVSGVDTVVHCAEPARALVDASRRAGVTHLVAISIVGVDRVPLGYYRRKLADERLLAASGLGWTVLRATQFHDLLAALLRMLSPPPVLAVPAGWTFQPVDVTDVAARLAGLASGPPAGRVADLGGPQVRPVRDLARSYLDAVGTRRAIVPVPVPGRIARGYRDGGHLASGGDAGTVTFEQYLARQVAAGTRPYDLGARVRRRAR